MSGISGAFPQVQSPSAKQAREVDRLVRKRLAESLQTIYARADHLIGFDQDRLAELRKRIEAGPVRPAVFGLYTDLVESVLSENADVAQDISKQLLDLEPSCNGTRIVTLTDDALGRGQAERYARLVDDDSDQVLDLIPLPDAESARRVGDALSLLDAGAPGLAEEVRALVREIVLVTTADGASHHFGASTFYLWGAAFLGIAKASRLELAQALAHEAAHLLLFGTMLGEPLVENDPGDRYASPLRCTPRPMEGVVHAAFVVARMHYCLERLLDTEFLVEPERQAASAELEGHREKFFDVWPVIEKNARFKPQAARIFRETADYMRCGHPAARVTH